MRKLVLFVLLLILFFSDRRAAHAGDIAVSLVSKTSNSATVSWQAYPDATSYTVYYDYFGGSGTCSHGPEDVGLTTEYSTGDVLPCGAEVFFIVESDNGGIGSLSIETDACVCAEADVSGDCRVNDTDVTLVRADMGARTACEGPFLQGDADKSGYVEQKDLDIVNSFLGQTCDPCTQEKHMECQETQCVEVVGSGENKCAQDIDCCICPEGGWVNSNCGEGNCTSGQRLQYCNPPSCGTLYQCIEDATCLGTLKGRVYLDINHDGSFQAGSDEYTQYPGTGCGGATNLAATISWTGAATGSTQVNLCDPNPYYSANVSPGNYSVSVSLPTGYATSSSNPATATVFSQETTQVLFGVVGGATVSGRIWNNTGRQNKFCSDLGLAGLSRLVCATGTGICQQSDSSGNYSLPNIPLNPNGLEVCFIPTSGWRAFCSSKTLVGNCASIASFTQDETVNFGLKQEPAAWFTVSEGDMHASGVFFSFINPIAAEPYLIFGPDGDPNNGCGVVTAGNIISLNGQKVSPEPHNWYQEVYSSGIGFEKALKIDFDSLWSQAQPDPGFWLNLAPGGIYRLEATIFGGVIHPFYRLSGPGIAVFLADSDVEIFNINRRDDSPPNSSVLLIVRGAVTVSKVCDPFSGDDKVDATIIVLDDGSPDGGTFVVDNFGTVILNQRDRKIRIQGMVYAENGVNLPRDRYKIDQNEDPVETFIYQPFFVDLLPNQLKKKRVSWKEIE